MAERAVTHPFFGRTIVVLDPAGRLAVALRERVDRAFATVIDPPAGTEAALAALRQPPWMLVGTSEALPPAVIAAVRSAPTLVAWLGTTPAGLPPGSVVAARFADLVEVVCAHLSREVAGMRLAPGEGVTMPDGVQRGGALLEALVAGYPRAIHHVGSSRRGVDRVLAEHGVAMRTAAAPGGGTVLAPVTHS